MSRIEEYQIDTNVQLTDMVIGTDVGDGNRTKNYRISDILALSGGGTSGVSSIRLLNDPNGLNGNVNFAAGTGVTITQSAVGAAIPTLTIGLTGGALLNSFVAGVVGGSNFTVDSVNNELSFTSTDGITLDTQVPNTISIGQVDSGVTGGTYPNPSIITVNNKGIITGITSGTGGTFVEANPTDAATTSLAKLKVDTTTYSIPVATQVQVSAPVNNAGTATAPIIGMAQANATTNGYLSANDFNSFNGKQAEITLTTTGTSGAATFNAGTGALNIPNYSTTGGVTSVTATSPVISSGGTTPVISMLAATTTQAGYLNPSDFNTFNNKQTEITLTTTGTGLATFNAATGALNIPDYDVSIGTNTQTGNVTWDSEGYNVSWVDFTTASFTNRQATSGTYQNYETNLIISQQGYRLSQFSNDLDIAGTNTWEVLDETKQYGIIERSSINNVTTIFSKEQIGSDIGFVRTFTAPTEGTRFVEQLYKNGVTTQGYFTNSNFQKWYGGSTDSFDADVIQGYYPPSSFGTIQLPQTPTANEGSIGEGSNSNGKIWSNSTTGEISYVDSTKAVGAQKRRLASYYDKSYQSFTNNSLFLAWDYDLGHNRSYLNNIANSTPVVLGISNIENGDYGNLIVDLTSATGTFTFTLPTNTLVANGGSASLSLAVGQIHTLTFTYNGTNIFCTVASNFT